MPNRARFVIHISLLLLITLFARPTSAYLQPAAEPPVTLSAIEVSREGYFVLQLTPRPEQALWIDYTSDAEWTEVQRTYAWFGDFEQMTLSGFANGVHYFRVRDASNNVLSNVVQVQVDHYPLWQALSLFFGGLVVFVVLVVLVIRNHRQSQQAKEGSHD